MSNARTDDRYPISGDQLLGYALCLIWRSRIIFHYELDSPAGRHVAVLLHIELSTVDCRLANGVERTREGLNEPDLEWLLG
jgi:hypothetical protein